MDIKMNKDITQYTEAVYFGLSMRQFIFTACAIAISVLCYFKFRAILPLEPFSWVCIGAAAPFAAMGFVKYQGQTVEQIFCSLVRYLLLTPKQLIYRSENYYYKALCDRKPKVKQEDDTAHDKDTTQSVSPR